MEFCLMQGSSGPEIGMLIRDLRALGFAIPVGDHFTDQVASALKVFQQAYHEPKGVPLKIDGRLTAATAIALDIARGRRSKAVSINEIDLPPMSEGGSIIARRAALIAVAEYMRASGEQGGNNLGPDVTRFKGNDHEVGAGWSAQFAAFCYREACEPDMSPLGNPKDAQGLVDLAWSKNWLRPDIGDGLQPGDLIVWYFDDPEIKSHLHWRGHVGIVWSYKDGQITTLEGDRGPYPSLVRPFVHHRKNLIRSTIDSQFKKGIGLIRLPK
jgi:hypothetical protein